MTPAGAAVSDPAVEHLRGADPVLPALIDELGVDGLGVDGLGDAGAGRARARRLAWSSTGSRTTR
jgi:hypothetical protein